MKFRLREVREEVGFTQGELAERAGVSRGTISLIEGGRISCVKTDTLVKLADALGKRVDALFF